MDEIGIDFFGISENHGEDYAVSILDLGIAALSAVTRYNKLESAVSVIISTNSVKVSQTFGIDDLLSNGRAEIIDGRGSLIDSFPLFGYNLKDYDALFDEKLKLLLKLNQEKIITWNGQFRAALLGQEIFPRPQQELLPIWVAVGGTPASV